MALFALLGPRKDVDWHAVVYALEHSPCLVVDAANVADPHRFHGLFSAEAFKKVFVVQTDLLYGVRDLLYRVPEYCERLGVRTVVLTTFDHLFHYQDVEENCDVRVQCWELLARLGRRYDVFVAVSQDGRYVWLAKKHAVIRRIDDMGHTVMSQREVVDSLLRELRSYSRALSSEDRVLFERVVRSPLKHLGSISYASSLHAWAFFLLSALVEQERRLEEVRCGRG